VKALVIVIVICCAFISDAERPERFAWDTQKKLRWSDFKAAPDYGSPYAATANSGISHAYAVDGRGFYDKDESKVTAHFYPTFSWYKPADTSDVILRHEQAHFDITEIHARKLRKRIAQFTFSRNSTKEVKILYDVVEKERREMQEQFDSDTHHSRDTQQEFVWENKIAKMLEDLKSYN